MLKPLRASVLALRGIAVTGDAGQSLNNVALCSGARGVRPSTGKVQPAAPIYTPEMQAKLDAAWKQDLDTMPLALSSASLTSGSAPACVYRVLHDPA